MTDILTTVPDVTMKYIRGWMQMVYFHMIYSPETDKEAWQRDHGKQWLAYIDNIYTHGQGTFVKYIKDIKYSSFCVRWVLFVMPDSSCRLLPAPWCCCLLLCWQLTAYLALHLGGRALPHPPHPGWPHFLWVPGNIPPLCLIQLRTHLIQGNKAHTVRFINKGCV